MKGTGMIIDNSTSQATTWSRNAGAASNRHASSRPGDKGSGTGHGADTVSISDRARAMYTNGKKIEKYVPALTTITPETTYLLNDTTKAAAGAGLRKYTNIGLGAGSTNLTAMNFSRKQISSRIEQALKKAGIELKGDEKISIKVNSKNEIEIAGIKDKSKAKKIAEALNDDLNLAREMRNHVAAGKINENAAKQEQYEKFLTDSGMPVPEDIDEMFTSPDMRNYIIDDYLMQNVGLGLKDLGLSQNADGSKRITGGDDRLLTLLSEDEQLGATIGKILESGDISADFAVSFDYANGALSDSFSKRMADEKIKGINQKLFGIAPDGSASGVADKFREKLEAVGGENNEAFMQALSRGFSIRVKQGGSFEIVGLDDMDPKLKDTLNNLLKQAMDDWAADFPNAMDGGSGRTASFADVFDTYLEEHKFEHGDTEEYPHELEIGLGGMPSNKMVSPEADKAKQAENEKLAADIGQSLRKDMAEKGIDVSNLEMEIGENGKITVKGDKNDPNVAKAQAFVDQFVKEAKAGKADAKEKDDDKEEKRLAEEERRKMIHGEDKSDTDLLTTARVEKKSELGLDDVDLESMPLAQRVNYMKARGWERAFPKNHEGVFRFTPANGVSDVKGGRYADDGGSDAASLYRRLMNGMGNFHDKPRSLSYSL